MAIITVGIGKDFLNAQDAADSIPIGNFTKTWELVLFGDAVFEDFIFPVDRVPNDTNRLVVRGDIVSRPTGTVTTSEIVAFPKYTTLKFLNLKHGISMGEGGVVDGCFLSSTIDGIIVNGDDVTIENTAIFGPPVCVDCDGFNNLSINHSSMRIREDVRTLETDVRSCLRIRNSTGLRVSNSAFQIDSLDRNRFSVFYDTQTASSISESDRNSYWSTGSASIAGIDVSGTVQFVSTLDELRTFTSRDFMSLEVNPGFVTNNLSLNTLSPLWNKADLLTSTDLKGNKRYSEGHTIGAYEIDSILFDEARDKLVQLLAGTSSVGIDEVVLGDGGTPSGLPYSRKGHTTSETDLENQTISIPLKPFGQFGLRTSQEGVAETEVGFCVTITALDAEEVNGGALLVNDQFDHYSEIGLKSEGVLLMKRNTGRIPFDPLVTVSTQINIAAALS